MARSEARLSVDMWQDAAFCALTWSEQRQYLHLVSQSDLGPDGRIALRVRRWAQSAKGLTADDVRADLIHLEVAGFIRIDWQGEEVTVREFLAPAPKPPRARRVPAPPTVTTPAPLRQPPSVRPRRRNKVSATKRRLVFIRDNFACQRCGWSVPPIKDYDGTYAPAGKDTSLRGRRAKRTRQPSLIWLELDHIHPYSRGGLDTVENYQALCSHCNGSKGASI